MARNETYSVELKEGQVDYLRRITEEHRLPNLSKTLRCLVSYAIERPELADEIFDEIRCLDC